MSELEPLEDDILALVKSAKDVPEIDPARKAGIFAATAGRIGRAGGGGDDGSGAGARAGAGAGAGAGVGAKLGLAIAMFVVGVGVGIGVDRAMMGGGEKVVSATAVGAATVAPAIESDAGALPLEAVSAASLPDAPRTDAGARAGSAAASARGAGSGEAPSSRGLAAERALLDVARSALARGEPSEALVATGRHAHDYPDGSLVEEREAIAIKALVALRRMDEARARARAHEQRFPNGLTVRAVKAAVEGAP
jgi:hypothetical protein